MTLGPIFQILATCLVFLFNFTLGKGQQADPHSGSEPRDPLPKEPPHPLSKQPAVLTLCVWGGPLSPTFARECYCFWVMFLTV